MGIFSKKSISTEAAQQPQPKNNAMADTMPQDASQQVPVAVTPPMQAPLQSPVFAAPQPQPQQATAPDAAVAAPQPQQAAAHVDPMEMPKGEPYKDYMRKPDIQPGTPVSVLPQNTVPQERIQSQRLDKMNGVPGSVVPEIPEPSQEPLQTQALERLQPSYWQKYGNYNWDSNDGDFWKNAKESGLSLRDAINYYNKWQEDNNGKPLDMFEQYALLKKYDPFRSMKEQDEEDERLKRQQKWEKISNLFNHLANLYGTVRGANPAQQIESGTDLTKRQQEAVDRVRALRKAAGQDYLDALMAKRADEFKKWQMENDAKRLAEQQRKNDLDDARWKAELERRRKADEENAAARAAAQAERERHNKESEKTANKNAKSREVSAQASRTRANNSGGGKVKGGAKVTITSTNKNPMGNGQVIKTEMPKDQYDAEQKKKKQQEAAKKKAAKKNSSTQKLANSWK